MVDIYSTEAERRAAIEEVTRLRRQFDTTTAKGAKAFAASKEAQDALARLDAAKSAAGMRTAAQDLEALNTLTGRKQTQQLNAPSREYFDKVSEEVYNNPNQVPTWKPPRKITSEQIQQASGYNVDLSKARYDWVWYEDPATNKGRWAMGVVGALENKPTSESEPRTYVGSLWRSDSATVKEVNAAWKNATGGSGGSGYVENTNPKGKGNTIYFDELEQGLPNLTFSQYQEIIYQLTLAKDTDITIEDILDKYDELYGEG
jgi:hypothetical protein